ncbi:FAD/NAD(P)-binding domain-containing protein [Guyanagaster necrorhizus]|uniref:FAD/NAD(P)-binding domain-containing protein n=1 Tax=Guyanagaster necrorhizus TaxID=856835 RepID=A0A9P8ANS2_9AGAR|nr:FAD/NAD(P)-binding domain-containing protein [Guyanagaster necrorhizus MCA 3950]KAG7442159.1 FAD/NAD(P)-binding domain-containing protein [Guyanagaster necrorhizus MCA 3950]
MAELNEKLRVAIIGGGVGGLTCAIALKDCKSLVVDLYESASKLTEIGAGITLWQRTWNILKNLGLEKDFLEIANEKPRNEPGPLFMFRRGDSSSGSDLYELMSIGAFFADGFHRHDVQKALLKNLPPGVTCHLSHRLVSYTETKDGMQLEFQNGRTAFCNLLIAADGIKSIVRVKLMAKLYPGTDNKFIAPVFSGTLAYRGLFLVDELAKRWPGHRALKKRMMYCGKNKHVVVYPVSQGRFINVVAFSSVLSHEGKPFDGPFVAEANKDEMMSNFLDWEDEVKAILQCIDNPTVWAIHALNPLDLYASDQVVLLGDAAHAMTPHLGAGAGQAVEDAYVLGYLLSKSAATLESIPKVLAAYSKIRQPYGNHILTSAKTEGLLYEFNAPGFEDIRDGDDRLKPRQMEDMMEKVKEGWAWSWSTLDLDQEAKAL